MVKQTPLRIHSEQPNKLTSNLDAWFESEILRQFQYS